MYFFANYNFRTDIKDGERGESVFVEYMESMGCNFINDNKDNKYDIKMTMPNGKEQTFEIKTDVWCIPSRQYESPVLGTINTPARDNGNMFIEFECRGKESGIVVTKADWFVTYFPHYQQMWIIKVDKLKKLIETENFPISERAGDEGSNTKGYLLPRNDYRNSFKIEKVDYLWES